MRVLFCQDPLDSKRVDLDYELEYKQVKALGHQTDLFSFENLVLGNISGAIRGIQASKEKEFSVYRGWMMKPQYYKILYEGLRGLNIELLNSPEEYTHCHYLPESYPIIEKMTPRSIWLPAPAEEKDWVNLYQLLIPFMNQPLIVKDYVKSRKHEWEDACYIPNASDQAAVRRVVSNFIDRQGSELNVGIVLREFVDFEFLQTHEKSQMPLSKEYRVFFLNYKPIAVFKYWDEVIYDEDAPDLQPFLEIAKHVKSNFFTMDIAKTVKGNWIIVELGDGQVSGLPDHANLESFYKEILKS
jgi:hypothetical protein